MKVVIFGTGFLGSKLLDNISKKFNVIGADINPINPRIHKVDATNKKDVKNFLSEINPDVVIDTVALSSYFLCEKDYDLCNLLNFNTAKNIADACRIIDAKMIFISSSYLYDGKKGNYSEKDLPNSTNNYAKSKIKAENYVLDLKKSIVLRLETLYGYDKNKNKIAFGTNTFDKEIEVGHPNLLRAPVYVDDVSRVILELIKKNKSGIFHVASNKKIRWIDFLMSLAEISNSTNKIKLVDSSSWILEPPNDSSLDTTKINSLKIHITSFNEAISELKILSE